MEEASGGHLYIYIQVRSGSFKTSATSPCLWSGSVLQSDLIPEWGSPGEMGTIEWDHLQGGECRSGVP